MPLLMPTQESQLRKSGFVRDYQTYRTGWISLAKAVYSQAQATVGLGNADPQQQTVADKLALLLVRDGLFQYVYKQKPWVGSLYVRPSDLDLWAEWFAKYIVQTDWSDIKS